MYLKLRFIFRQKMRLNLRRIFYWWPGLLEIQKSVVYNYHAGFYFALLAFAQELELHLKKEHN